MDNTRFHRDVFGEFYQTIQRRSRLCQTEAVIMVIVQKPHIHDNWPPPSKRSRDFRHGKQFSHDICWAFVGLLRGNVSQQRSGRTKSSLVPSLSPLLLRASVGQSNIVCHNAWLLKRPTTWSSLRGMVHVHVQFVDEGKVLVCELERRLYLCYNPVRRISVHQSASFSLTRDLPAAYAVCQEVDQKVQSRPYLRERWIVYWHG